jgi:hypothetical protein
MWDSAEWQAVVYVSDRRTRGLRRRERCLKVAGIAHAVLTERRPSGTYHKLCVRTDDAVAAHLALRMGGHQRSIRLREQRPGIRGALRELQTAVWDEVRSFLDRVLELVRGTAEQLLPDSRPPSTSPESSRRVELHVVRESTA